MFVKVIVTVNLIIHDTQAVIHTTKLDLKRLGFRYYKSGLYNSIQGRCI